MIYFVYSFFEKWKRQLFAERFAGNSLKTGGKEAHAIGFDESFSVKSQAIEEDSEVRREDPNANERMDDECEGFVESVSFLDEVSLVTTNAGIGGESDFESDFFEGGRKFLRRRS